MFCYYSKNVYDPVSTTVIGNVILRRLYFEGYRFTSLTLIFEYII